ncbi:MAG: squalene--hopene cyclase [Planctomycetota bacterium]|nr:MAG: squalene--hopene cyclase [Planctomycetota bacterium]REJ93873.1 MAG: squalene--hopene cyclase [Planctomycetota bacterium]REK29934.1 MAG: squalene--hopene cyclase [Planctomycetota bacterium]REK47896.1 MAG: squalene--hopene cyclase [Planctomycetota bacterium]
MEPQDLQRVPSAVPGWDGPAESVPTLSQQPVETPIEPGAVASEPSTSASPAESPLSPVAVTEAGNSPVLARPVANAPVRIGPPQPPPLFEEEDVEQEESLASLYFGFAPAWLASLVVHLLLFILLGALMMITPGEPEPVTIRVQQYDALEIPEGEQLELPEVEPELPAEIVEPEPVEFTADELTLEEMDLASTDEVDPVDFSDVGELTPHGFRSVERSTGVAPRTNLSGRGRGMKRRLLHRYGGTAATEAAVDAGLAWLVRQQFRNGEWRLSGPFNNGNRAPAQNPNAATAMALLAFQGAGYTDRDGGRDDYVSAVRRGWYRLLRRQGRNGSFAEQTDSHQHFYTHAICTLAACEIYAMTRDARFREPAQRAVNYLVKRQDREGGWRYGSGGSDLSVSGWAMMALQSARMGKLKVPKPTLDRFAQYLDKVSHRDHYGSRYGYRTGSMFTPAMSAEGLLCRQYMGWKRNRPQLLRGVEYLLEHPIDYDNQPNVYYWYYATQVLHHMEGDLWNKWNNVMRVEVPARQVQQGPERGSWSPQGDYWGGEGGRLYVTCLSIYMLEVYYRHLPIYSQDKWHSGEALKAAAEEDTPGGEEPGVDAATRDADSAEAREDDTDEPIVE